jgi:hypothetical protein
MVYIFLLLDMQSGHITTKDVGLNHASAPVYSTLLQNFIRFNNFLARKWDPNQLQTVRYQVLLSVYMSHYLSRLYLKTKHFCLQIWYWGNEGVPPWFCHCLRCFKATNTPLSSETFIFWTLRDCDQAPDIVPSGVAIIDATTHLRAQTNPQTNILLHFVVRLQINLCIN